MKLTTLAAIAAMTLGAASAASAFQTVNAGSTANDSVSRVSVNVGNSTWQPALAIVVGGVKTVYTRGTLGLTNTIIYSAEKANAWAMSVAGAKLVNLNVNGGGGTYDVGPDGISGTADDIGGIGENGGGGW